MLISFTVELWMLLPLVLSVVLLAGGLYVDCPGWMDMEGTIIALIFSVLGWFVILVGRFDHWLVVPTLLTALGAFFTYQERRDLKLEGVRFMACVFVLLWLLVLYGWFTA